MHHKKRFVKVCPHCGSTSITIPPAGMDVKMSLPDYCSDCMNWGVFPEVEEDKINDFKKQLRENNKNKENKENE